MWNDVCRWARPRLPLMAGGELTGSDRRKVERHLIGCAECRDRLARLNVSLGAMHSLAVESLPLTDTASLWPALARQIREQRRTQPAFWSRPSLWVAIGMAASAVVAASSWSLTQYQRHHSLQTAALPAPKAPVPVSPTSQAVSEVGGGATVADNHHRPEAGETAAAAPSPSPVSRNPGPPGSGLRAPEPTH